MTPQYDHIESPDVHAQVCPWSGRVTWLGTGIADLKAAKRYLKKRHNLRPLPPIERRPGARWYVTARTGHKAAFLLGPYSSHVTALANVSRGQALASERYGSHFLTIGTASTITTRTTIFGR